MKQIHKQEKIQFKKLFSQENIEQFEDRFTVLESFLQTERHLTAGELTEQLTAQGHRLEPSFVGDTLRMMCRFGFARQHRFDNGEVRYEHRHLGHHHDHMVCTKCRRIIEFRDQELEDLQVRIAEANGFHMLQHRMEIYGICDQCIKNRSRSMPLSSARPGERLVIREFSGGPTARMRLLAMGLRIGDTLEVITNVSKGQLAVAVDFKRYVLGRGLAQKIRVEPAAGPDRPQSER